MTRYLLTAALALGTIACTSNQRAEVREDTAETRARATDTWETERTEYSRKMQDRLDRIDREMEEERVKAKTRKMNAKAQREYDEKMREMDQLKAQTREQYNQAKSATKEGWEDFKRGMDTAADKLERGWDSFVADLKS